MTNPFSKSAAAEDKPTISNAGKATAETAPGDPFASPTGVSGEYITEFVGRLLLVKPTEYVPEMNTSKGKNDAMRVDLAILDDEEEPGRIVTGVLLFQTALKREAKAVFEGTSPYLLGRLHKGTTGGGNTLYTFQAADEDEMNVARQFLAVAKL